MKEKMSTTTNGLKLENIQVIDLFSGCGGLSLGFKMAGFNITSAVDIDLKACNTMSYNILWKYGINKELICKDIKKVNPDELINNNYPVITIGGPPCQAYSKIGRSKLRSLGDHRFGFNDSRAFLYREFIRISVNLDSVAIVMENVPESVDFFGLNIPQIVCEELENQGYNAIWTILNAADYGVPQTRERVFVIAVKKEFGEVSFLPEPTHINPNQISLEDWNKKFKKYSKFNNFKYPLVPDKECPKWVTVGDALSDLPALFPTSDSKYVLHKMNTKLPYQTPPTNDYQKLMRKEKDNTFKKDVDANCFRKTLRDFRIFERMQPGDDYVKAHQIALELFEEACEYYQIDKNDTESYEKLKKQYVPPYDTSKFHGKWKKLDPNKPSHTLVAHLGTDTYSHIHPIEPRGISVREAARLQSFPDNYTFTCSMGDAFKQIGNAVPPLLAKGVAKAVLKNLRLEKG